jgi:hypothetical protein
LDSLIVFEKSLAHFAKHSPIIEGMRVLEQREIYIPAGISLRGELSLRALHLASLRGYRHARTDGQVPGVLFGLDEAGRHGNFHPASYREICANPLWARRLEKVHTTYRRMRPRADWPWKELDCSNSSDALLMNVFCHPQTMAGSGVRHLIDTTRDALPEFGCKPRVPLQQGKRDNTEVDMRIGDLLVEAKLTESDFQWASEKLIARYRDLEEVFDVSELPTRNGRYGGYQLIRGTLAAYASERSFCLLCDARRPDLVEVWFRVLRAVRLAELRSRLKLLTWQELGCVLPRDLQEFLAQKYGVAPPR